MLHRTSVLNFRCSVTDTIVSISVFNYCIRGAQGDKNVRPKLESVVNAPSTETAIDEHEGIFESQMRSLDDMASDDNTNSAGATNVSVSIPALRSYAITGNPLSPGSGPQHFVAPSTPTISSSGAHPLAAAAASNSRGENSVGTNYVHIVPCDSIASDSLTAAAALEASASVGLSSPFVQQTPGAGAYASYSPSATKYADRPLAPRQPNNGYALQIPVQPLSNSNSATYSSANFGTTSNNNGSSIPLGRGSFRDRLRTSECSERESVLFFPINSSDE